MTWQIGTEHNLYGKRIFNECVELSSAIVSLLPCRKSVIVDCGCGRGGLLTLLKQAGYRKLVGYDFTPKRVEVCRGFGLNVFEQDIHRIPLWNNAANCVVYEESLEYLDDEKYLSSLQEASRVLVRRGYLIIASLTFGSEQPDSKTGYERSLDQDKILSVLPNFVLRGTRQVLRSKKHICRILIMQKVM